MSSITIRQIALAARRLDPAALAARAKELRGEIEGLEILRQAVAARDGVKGSGVRGQELGVRIPPADSFLVKRIMTRLGLQQPASAAGIAGDLNQPVSNVTVVLESLTDRFTRTRDGLWRLTPRSED